MLGNRVWELSCRENSKGLPTAFHFRRATGACRSYIRALRIVDFPVGFRAKGEFQMIFPCVHAAPLTSLHLRCPSNPYFKFTPTHSSSHSEWEGGGVYKNQCIRFGMEALRE